MVSDQRLFSTSIRCAFGAVLFLTVALAQAEDESGERDAEERREDIEEIMEASCRDEQGRPESWLDRTHSYLSRKLCEPAAWFDGFFGDPRAAEETSVGSFFRLRNSLIWDETENFGHDIRVSANLSLPRVSDRIRLLIASDDSVEGDVGFADVQRDEDEQTRLGLRFLLSETGRTQFDLDGTVKVNTSGLNPRVRARGRHTWGLSDTTLARFTQTAFWEREDGFGTVSRADWEWLPDSLSLVRLTGRGTFSEVSDGVDWRAGLIGFRQLNRTTAIRSELGAFGYTRPEYRAEELFINFRYRRAFLRDWLFYEIQPEYAWPYDEERGERRSDLRLILTLEIQFENPVSRRERAERQGDEAPLDHYRGR
ncbi:hypothetical protein HFP89_10775 [Wenzhouxiangella sp. XN79A]|uniref:hypothetical protein n=1 Tax=Wenzhouxiangella sp. XN79A TaxID=2724193 RepID=UPI00144A6BC6|nr:hypothetical protein [Wenzhouxiangella sp. XN79A]NKI35648.1 hypothetical protein [Wenzhouxiangella sp. XN79A]